MAATVRGGMPVWATLLVEFFLVILAVLLALWAGEWVKSKEREARALSALEAIYFELQGNRQFLQIITDQHASFAENFDERVDVMMTLDPLTASPEEIAKAGFIPFRGWDSAWTLAQQSNALSDIDYEYAVAVTAAYSMQEIYSDFGSGFSSISYDLEYQDPENSDLVREALKANLATFVAFNAMLATQYDASLEKIKSHPKLKLGDE